MKSRKIITITMSLIIVVSISSCNFSSKLLSIQGKEEVKVEETKTESVSSKSDTVVWGEVRYTDSYAINIDFPSTVEKLSVQEGDAVHGGDVLVTLNIDQYQKNLQKLNQQVYINEVALADVTQDGSAINSDIVQIKKDIDAKTDEYEKGTKAELQILQNKLTRTNKEIEDAKKDCETQQALYNSNAIAKETLDNFYDLLDQKEKAKIDIENNIKKTQDALKTEIDALKTSLEYKQVQLSKMKNSNAVNTDKQTTSISISQTDLEIMKSKSNKTYLQENKIVSNVENGIIQNINVINGTELGSQNGSTKILEIIDADTIVVMAEVPEEFIKNIKQNDIVKIIPSADKDKTISGTVTRISNVAIEKDGERIVKVEVKPDDTERFLKSGYSVDVIFK